MAYAQRAISANSTEEIRGNKRTVSARDDFYTNLFTVKLVPTRDVRFDAFTFLAGADTRRYVNVLVE